MVSNVAGSPSLHGAFYSTTLGTVLSWKNRMHSYVLLIVMLEKRDIGSAAPPSRGCNVSTSEYSCSQNVSDEELVAQSLDYRYAIPVHHIEVDVTNPICKAKQVSDGLLVRNIALITLHNSAMPIYYIISQQNAATYGRRAEARQNCSLPPKRRSPRAEVKNSRLPATHKADDVAKACHQPPKLLTPAASSIHPVTATPTTPAAHSIQPQSKTRTALYCTYRLSDPYWGRIINRLCNPSSKSSCYHCDCYLTTQ